jgi:predicted CopG family antitoxin
MTSKERKVKTINVREEIWNELNLLKYQVKLTSISNVIEALLNERKNNTNTN